MNKKDLMPIFVVLILAIAVVSGVDIYKHKGKNTQIQHTQQNQSPNNPSSTSNTDSQTMTTTPINTYPPSASTPSCISATQAWKDVGMEECVQYVVSDVYTSYSGNVYLNQYANYAAGFSAYIPYGQAISSTQAQQYQNQTVDVTGTISSYDGAPEIVVNSPSQVSIAN